MKSILFLIKIISANNGMVRREIKPKSESQLYKKLFNNYSSLIRPVRHANESVIIEAGRGLLTAKYSNFYSLKEIK